MILPPVRDRLHRSGDQGTCPLTVGGLERTLLPLRSFLESAPVSFDKSVAVQRFVGLKQNIPKGHLRIWLAIVASPDRQDCRDPSGTRKRAGYDAYSGQSGFR